mmetsp:Transcript_35238/g.56632  ORF Transcript_35238/g.56632 Transcript_35238/m.56632 type:complete len:91 (-) Transcript_35238:87-359(-)
MHLANVAIVARTRSYSCGLYSSVHNCGVVAEEESAGVNLPSASADKSVPFWIFDAMCVAGNLHPSVLLAVDTSAHLILVRVVLLPVRGKL